MQKNQQIIVQIDGVGVGGEGIAHTDGYTVFVPFALLGEQVEVLILRVRHQLVYAKLLRVLAPSDARVQPPCPVFGKCGGCDLMMASYAYQLELKRRGVEQTLGKNGNTCPVGDCVPSPRELGYRNKISLPFGVGKDGEAVLGFFRSNSHDVVAISACPLHGEWVDTLIEVTLSFVRTHRISVYNSETGRGLLRHLVARKIGDGLDVALVLNGTALPHQKEYIQALSRAFEHFCLYINVNRIHNNVIMGGEQRLAYGAPSVLQTEGITATVNPLSFLQVNDGVRDRIYRDVATVVGAERGAMVIDAFAGIGIIGATLARKGAIVHNIEIVPEAVADADRLAKENGLATQITNHCGDSGVLLHQVLDEVRKGAPKAWHSLHLQKEPFRAIACGEKTYELRLWDEKRSCYKVGDLLRFEGEEGVLWCRITSLCRFDSFKQLFHSLPISATCSTSWCEATREEIQNMGICAEDMDEALCRLAAESMSAYYTPAQQEKYGVVAIGIERVQPRGVSIILDPPRKGVPQGVVDALNELAEAPCFCDLEGISYLSVPSSQNIPVVTLPYVQHLVYISCNPATLSRDLALLTGYKALRITPYDMFPQTAHVESVVCLKRQIQQ